MEQVAKLIDITLRLRVVVASSDSENKGIIQDIASIELSDSGLNYDNVEYGTISDDLEYPYGSYADEMKAQNRVFITESHTEAEIDQIIKESHGKSS